MCVYNCLRCGLLTVSTIEVDMAIWSMWPTVRCSVAGHKRTRNDLKIHKPDHNYPPRRFKSSLSVQKRKRDSRTYDYHARLATA